MRYFIDLDSQSEKLYDHKGHELSTEDAYLMAELVALDLEVHGQWIGWSVAVRDPKGVKLFSVPVQSEELDVPG